MANGQIIKIVKECKGGDCSIEAVAFLLIGRLIEEGITLLLGEFNKDNV